MLAIAGSEKDTWGPLPDTLVGPRLARVPQLKREKIEGAGHFVHMERPVETARAIVDFLRA
jgi:pimeloyl-ACP methyl ester carboxylesterase